MQAIVLKNLDHPNIVRLKDVYESKNNLYIVMELWALLFFGVGLSLSNCHIAGSLGVNSLTALFRKESFQKRAQEIYVNQCCMQSNIFTLEE